jgi:shikimate dehydrogenase
MTIRCFVAGDPIAQSRSPMIHGHWITAGGLDAAYVRERCAVPDLPALLARVRSGDYAGGNLTAPLKEAVLPLLDRLTPEAEAMRAVNTVFMRDGALWGANTDVAGYFAALDAAAAGWDARPANVVMLGAGGAGRAIALGLLRRNVAELTIVNRTLGTAETLVGFLDDARVSATPWPVEAGQLGRASLIVNTTALGMEGKPPLDMDWPAALAGVTVSDIVYVPLETPFLAQARARGAVCVDGLGMLLHQASYAFAHWFGHRPPVTAALRALIEADLRPLAPRVSGTQSPQ